jgi:hypothetical protein
VNSNEDLVIAAITPLNKSVKIRITPVNTQDNFDTDPTLFWFLSGGWLVETINNQEFIIRSQRENILVSYFFNLSIWSNKFPINIEYYENGSITPTFSKTVTFF